jgi:DNA topoisomerase VI subunit B
MKTLDREILTFSRDLEFFELNTLRAATGQNEGHFHHVILKELIDNALDACERDSVNPEILVEIWQRDNRYNFKIGDNAGGLDKDVIERIIDIRSFTSNKSAYKSPTRGAQGNALKTIMGIPVALSGLRECEPLHIRSKGIQYTIHVKPE